MDEKRPLGRFGITFNASPFGSTLQRLKQYEADAEAAAMRLLMVTDPHRVTIVNAEVQRRWGAHCEMARTTGRRNLGRAAVIDAVYRDVCDGLL